MEESDYEKAANILEARYRSLLDEFAGELVSAPQLRVAGGGLEGTDSIVESYAVRLCHHDACIKLLRREVPQGPAKQLSPAKIRSFTTNRQKVVQLECANKNVAETISEWLGLTSDAFVSIRNISLLEKPQNTSVIIVYDTKSALETTEDEAQKIAAFINKANAGASDSSSS